MNDHETELRSKLFRKERYFCLSCFCAMPATRSARTQWTRYANKILRKDTFTINQWTFCAECSDAHIEAIRTSLNLHNPKIQMIEKKGNKTNGI